MQLFFLSFEVNLWIASVLVNLLVLVFLVMYASTTSGKNIIKIEIKGHLLCEIFFYFSFLIFVSMLLVNKEKIDT